MPTQKAKDILKELNSENISMGQIKKMAKDIKKDHALSMELWESKGYYPRLLAVLILDKNELTEELIEKLAEDINIHEESERNQLADWLMANQLTKSKKTIAMMKSWEQHNLPILRRLFWYYQARLRWTGKTPPDNTAHLVESLEERMQNEAQEVQWAMNFCAGQIGIHEVEYRERCVALGEKIGLYKDQKVPKGCTPNYLPEFIRIESEKRNK